MKRKRRRRKRRQRGKKDTEREDHEEDDDEEDGEDEEEDKDEKEKELLSTHLNQHVFYHAHNCAYITLHIHCGRMPRRLLTHVLMGALRASL